MFAGLEEMLLGSAEREALARVADLASPTVLSGLSPGAPELTGAEMLLSGWGCPRLDAGWLERLPALRYVSHAAGTVRDLVTPKLWERGIRVSSAAAANAIPVAEYTLAAILLANKGAFASNQRYHASGAAAARVGSRVGNRDRRIGIVGASRIGRLVIERLHPFELEVVLCDPLVSAEDARALGVRKVELDELLATSQVTSLHAPLLPETRGLIGARELARMPDGATLINTARGKLCDAAALEAELVTGRICAVIDTSDPDPLPDDTPLRGRDNVFLTPHIAGSLGTELPRMASLAISELARFAQGEPLLHEVTRADLERVA